MSASDDGARVRVLCAVERLATTGLIILGLSIVFGCSTTSRHPEAERFGDRAGATSWEETLEHVRVFDAMDDDVARSRVKDARVTALGLGAELFRDAKLGKNGRSCNTCHVDGGTRGDEAQLPRTMGHGPYKLPIPALSGAAARYPKFIVPADRVITLEMMNNFCIRRFMDGKRLPLDSPEAFFLALYVTSLSAGTPMQIGD